MKIFPVPHNLLIPLTTRWAEWVTEPAGLVALHVYWPTWLWLTAEMVSMLVLLPSIVVDKSGEEEMISPFKLQVIDKGSSPFRIIQTSWANSPSLTVSAPKEKGTISGGTASETILDVRSSECVMLHAGSQLLCLARKMLFITSFLSIVWSFSVIVILIHQQRCFCDFWTVVIAVIIVIMMDLLPGFKIVFHALTFKVTML